MEMRAEKAAQMLLAKKEANAKLWPEEAAGSPAGLGPLPSTAEGASRVRLAHSFDSPDLMAVMEELRGQLARRFPIEGTEAIDLYVFGSAMNGFGNALSDIDVSMVVKEGRTPKTGRLTSKSYIKQVLQLTCCCFSGKESLFRVQELVLTARIPILILVHRSSGRQLDLSVNNLAPLANTFLLRTYSRLDSRICTLGKKVKQWAKDQGVCDASSGWLSSYDLVLMVIYFLQVEKGLPSLQKACPQQDWMKGGLPPTECWLLDKRSLHGGSSDHWFHDFFHFYAGKFSWLHDIVSIRLGRPASRSDPALATLKRSQVGLDIEDPFLLDRNLAKHFRSIQKYNWFREAIVAAIRRPHAAPGPR